MEHLSLPPFRAFFGRASQSAGGHSRAENGDSREGGVNGSRAKQGIPESKPDDTAPSSGDADSPVAKRKSRRRRRVIVDSESEGEGEGTREGGRKEETMEGGEMEGEANRPDKEEEQLLGEESE